MRSEGVRSERMALLTTKPLSATRGSGELQVSMAAGLEGLLGVVAVTGETGGSDVGSGPDQERVLAVLEVTARWWGGDIRGREVAVACRTQGGRWVVGLLRKDACGDGEWRLGDWMVPRWPGEPEGSSGAVIGLFGAAAKKAISCIDG